MQYKEYKSKYEITRDKLRDIYNMSEVATHEEILIEALKRAKERETEIKEKLHTSNREQILDSYTH